MRNSDTAELKFELVSAADDSRYHVHSRLEIAAILRELMTRKALLSVFFEEGNASVITALLDVDADNNRMFLDRGPDEQTNKRLLQAQRLVCITTLDKVKVQFVCAASKSVTYGKHEAFQLPLPEKLLRLQRREYFRLSLPLINPPQCILTGTGDASGEHQKLGIVDISCGGFSANFSPGTPLSDPLSRFECEIPLTDIGTLRTLIELRNTFEVTLPNNRKVHRCGYQFVNLPEPQRVMLQRYIMNQQRNQKLRTGGRA